MKQIYPATFSHVSRSWGRHETTRRSTCTHLSALALVPSDVSAQEAGRHGGARERTFVSSSSLTCRPSWLSLHLLYLDAYSHTSFTTTLYPFVVDPSACAEGYPVTPVLNICNEIASLPSSVTDAHTCRHGDASELCSFRQLLLPVRGPHRRRNPRRRQAFGSTVWMGRLTSMRGHAHVHCRDGHKLFLWVTQCSPSWNSD